MRADSMAGKIITLEDRMRSYEMDNRLPSNLPVIIRIDGRAFSKFTRGMGKPFDLDFIGMMNEIAIGLCNDMQNCRLAYLQSDEISFLLYQRIDSEPWFGNKVQKLCSIASSKASSIATRWVMENLSDKNPIVSFDARANIYPLKDVANYFIWRQKDWERNSLFMVASSYYSAKQLRNKNRSDQNEMIFQKGDNWDKYPTMLKRGRCVVRESFIESVDNENFKGDIVRSRWVIDNEIPIFTKDRVYIEGRLE